MNEDHLKAQLAVQEGRKTRPYVDTVGKITWGVGRNTSDVDWSPDELALVNQLIGLCLRNDIQKSIRYAILYPWYAGLNDARQNVVLNLIFNMGPKTFAEFKKFHAAMQSGDWTAACAELAGTRWQKQVDPVLGDGKGRADTLLAQLESGVLAT